MKVVFLDIDGVVNTVQYSDEPKYTTFDRDKRQRVYAYICTEYDKAVSDGQAVMLLNKLCLETGAKIVISSTWKHGRGGYKLVEECLRNSGLDEQVEVIDATPDIYEVGSIRGDEIKAWLDKHPETEQYVILDDDDDMLEEQFPHLVQCNHHLGFKYLEYEQALDLLGTDSDL